MKTRQTTVGLLLGVVLLGLGGTAQAGLIGYTANGVNLVYDNDRDLTWVANANLADTVDFGVAGINANGTMTWDVAEQWVAGMNAANYAGATGWRLPATLQPDATCDSQLSPGGGFPLQGYGYNCTGSDLGHLFYTEGLLTPGQAITSSTILTGLFSNMQDHVYWSGTQYAPVPDDAWVFGTFIGLQGVDDKDFQGYGWAVRPGQVAAAPLPATGFLVALGLMALGASRQGRRATLALRRFG
jgi:hypothetical protein